MLYFSMTQDDSYQIIAPISCIMASFHKLNQTDIVGCVLEDKMAIKEEVKSSYLAICQFITLSTLSGNNIYTDHLENHQKQLDGF